MAFPVPDESMTALVTGASSGIGREMAVQLSRQGWHVTLVARRREVLDDVAAECDSSTGCRVAPADLADAGDRSRLVAEISGEPRRVAVLVNNAGFSTVGPAASVDIARELQMIRTNVEAVVHLCASFVGSMVDAGSGAVLNVASTAAFQPIPGQAGYGATKAFVLSYSRALRTEVAGAGVTVTTLCPGPVKTGFIEAAGMNATDAEAALPQFMWVDAATVAAAAISGVEAGRAVVIPGLANRVSAQAAYLTPKSVLLPLLARRHPSLH